MFHSIWLWVSPCGNVIGLFWAIWVVGEYRGENGLYDGEFRDCFVLISSSDWSSPTCSAALLFPASICIVFPSTALVALFVNSRILGSKIPFKPEFVLSSSDYLTTVFLSIL